MKSPVVLPTGNPTNPKPNQAPQPFASERADEAGAEVVDLPDWRTRTKMN